MLAVDNRRIGLLSFILAPAGKHNLTHYPLKIPELADPTSSNECSGGVREASVTLLPCNLAAWSSRARFLKSLAT